MVTYLVGTCHVDLKGPQRLRKFLDFVRPSSICHEGSEEFAKGLFEERRYGIKTFLQMANQPDPALKFAAMLEYVQGYEIWVPHQHKQENNPTANIYPLENQQVLQDALECLNKLLEKEDVYEMPSVLEKEITRELMNGDIRGFQKYIDTSYFDSKAVADFRSLVETDYLLEERDKPMEQKIREITLNDAKGTTVVVCGSGHIFGEYKNLYERLRDLSPCRLRLPELDKF
ncbi:MAG: hypothetical protein AABX24_03955 [Nanoarchaeota archaeon]